MSTRVFYKMDTEKKIQYSSLYLAFFYLVNVIVGLFVYLFVLSFLTYIIALKSMSHAINSHVLTDKNPCINQAIHVLLMHGFCALHIRILGRHKNRRHQQ